MDTDSVARFLPEEVARKRNSCAPGRRFCVVLVVLAFLSLVVLIGIVFHMSVENANKYEDLKEHYDERRTKDKEKTGSKIGLKTLIDNRINESESSWRRKVNAHFDSIGNNLESRITADRKLGSDMNKSFESVKSDINNLTTTVDNLILSLLRINVSSDRKILDLRNILNDIKGDLNRTRDAMSQLDGNLRNDLTNVSNSLNRALNNLKKELRILSTSTTTQVNELRSYWNETNTEFEQTLRELSHQNSSLHLKVDFHSNTLYKEVKKVEKQLARLSNTTIIETTRDKQQLHDELNATRHSLQGVLRKEITRANTSMYTALQNIARTLKSSLTNVNAKMDDVKNELQVNITKVKDNQKKIKYDLSETKEDLQGVDRRHERNISALAFRLKNMTNAYVHLKNNLESEGNKREKLETEVKELRIIVDKLKNEANGIMQFNIALVLSMVSLLMYI